MATVRLKYSVPVVALVDTESGEVLRVVVLDDEIQPDMDLSDLEAAAAVRLADEADWPSWEFGF